MTATPGAADLLRGLGLMADGPVLWGTSATSRRSGIFVVERASPIDAAPIDTLAVRRWIERVPALRVDGERPTPTGLGARLASFWLPGQTVLYVGRTLKALGPRVAALYATPLGDRRPHAGGHWLKTLSDVPRLRLWWAETDAPEEYEDALLAAFAESVAAGPGAAGGGTPGDLLPWAVLESPTGTRRQTGILDSLLSEEGAAATRRVASATPKRRSPSAARCSTVRAATTRRRKAPAPPSAPVETYLTATGLVGLQAELDRLLAVERPAVIGRVKHARELGDLRENADYEAARNEQSFLEGRIRDLEARVRTAVIIEVESSGKVALGSTVSVEHEGVESVLVIVGSTESDPANGRISQASPVGRALLGHHAGDEVVVRTPRHELRYRIVSVH